MNPMKCQMCHADFVNERALMDHILQVTHIDVTPKEDGPDKAPVIPILCPICPKKLANKTLFMGHMHRHRVMESRLASGKEISYIPFQELARQDNFIFN